MEVIIVDAFGAMIEYFALYTFLWIFFELEPTRKGWRRIGHVIMPLLFFLFASSISNIYLRPALFILCSWLIALGFRGNFWSRIFSVSVFQIILILFEINISFFLQPLTIFSPNSNYLFTNIFVKCSTLFILIALFLISHKRQIVFARLQTRYILILLLFSAMSLFMVSFCEYLLLVLDKPSLYSIGCVGILLSIFVNVALYYLFYQLAIGEEAKVRLQFMDFHLSCQKEQQSYLDNNYQEIRKLSHDLNHYLAAVYYLLQQGEITAAMKELEKRQLEINNYQLFDTGYPMLNSILAYKFQVAREQRIQTQLFWNLIEPLQLNLTDLAVILSNGLDNAIEAASQVTASRPFLSVTAETKNEFIKVCICNNTAIDPLIVEGKIATTKQNKKLHGLGLESMQTLANRYQGEIFLGCKNRVFTLHIILKNIVRKPE